MAIFISHSPEETQEFAAALGQRVASGTVLGLVGDLGAGKTRFVKGLARGLGVTEPVLSPTFALLHMYGGGRLPLYHLDLYRLESQEQIIGAGLTEYFEPNGVTVVEWWDRWGGAPPPALRVFNFEEVGESTRKISYADPGP